MRGGLVLNWSGENCPEVDVWGLRLTSTGVQSEFLSDLLSRAERDRADAFRAEAHQQKFKICRGVLRLLLGRYLGEDPRGLEFELGSFGKPFLKANPLREAGSVRFNIAHSGDLALYAFSRLEVGIDIEQMRPVADMMRIARRFFSAAEAGELATLTGDARAHAFHHCWARKEAYIKALGLGLSLPLESFQVSLLPGEGARIKEIRGSPGEEAEWLLADLPMADNYAAALAVRMTEISLWTSPVLEPGELNVALDGPPVFPRNVLRIF